MTGNQFEFLADLSLSLAAVTRRELPDGREAMVILQMFNSKITVGRGALIDDSW